MNARSPYVQNVRDLVRHPGEMRERTVDLEVPERLGEGLVAVQQGSPLHVDLRLESLHEGVLASGDVVATAQGECARCLAPVSLPVEVEFAELFGYPADEPFDHQLDGDLLDLEPVVRDAVVLALPFQPECVDGCEDLELGPGISLITADARAEEPADPRWAALQGFTAQDPDSREEK
ncbi:YceD family protein [Amnibacterium endophyticum]|uniref:YceD family protein n=1 Tax=Amnibacterium endophyticum TaxID=2109337 RepID=A0ABW4LK74_9MICO